MIRDAARDFAQNELLPGVIRRDEEQAFPSDQIKQLGELGFLGMMVNPKYGGAGMDTVSYILAMEEISKIEINSERRACFLLIRALTTSWGMLHLAM